MSENNNNHVVNWIDTAFKGRKFFAILFGVILTYWFALVWTYVANADNPAAWTFLGTFTWIAVGGVLLYAGVNVWQHVKLNNNKK